MKKALLAVAVLGLMAGAQAQSTQHSHEHGSAQHAHHGANDAAQPFVQEYLDGMMQMHDDMMSGIMSADADAAFAKGMLPHHQGAVAMAETELKYGKDETMRKLAEDIIAAQQAEIELMQGWIAEHPSETLDEASAQDFNRAYIDSMHAMHDDMMDGIASDDADMAFAKGMLPHHEGAVAMAEIQLEYGKDETMRKLAEDIIAAQQAEIELMQQWIAEHSH